MQTSFLLLASFLSLLFLLFFDYSTRHTEACIFLVEVLLLEPTDQDVGVVVS